MPVAFVGVYLTNLQMEHNICHTVDYAWPKPVAISHIQSYSFISLVLIFPWLSVPQKFTNDGLLNYSTTRKCYNIERESSPKFYLCYDGLFWKKLMLPLRYNDTNLLACKIPNFSYTYFVVIAFVIGDTLVFFLSLPRYIAMSQTMNWASDCVCQVLQIPLLILCALLHC